MSKQALEALLAKFTALEQKLDAGLKPAGNDNKDEEKPTDDYAALAGKVDKLTELYSALQAKLEGGKDDKKADDKPVDQFAQLADELKALREDFNKAVNATNGTNAGEHKGDGTDLSHYI